MKKSLNFFIWIVLMIFGLMAVLVITQFSTSQSINRLVNGNRQAAVTFVINNRLEEIVNTSFDLEAKLLVDRTSSANTVAIKDSVNGLLNKAVALDLVINEAAISTSMDTILQILKKQVSLSTAIINTPGQTQLVDSLRKMNFSDSVYMHALGLQTRLEKALGATLAENNKVASRVSWLNKILAFTALLAVLILATIILRRQIMQFILIRDLEQARKLALQSVKAKDQFLANMSHEIRTPLNALKGFSNLLSRTKLNPEQQEYSNIINSSSENLLQIVNDILDLSKMESGSLVLKNKPFRLRPLLQQLNATYSASAKEKMIAFNILIPDTVPDELTGDADRLNQILVNLVSNAIKFTNEGDISISLEAVQTSNESCKIKFTVRDTGIGIPYDKQKLIFERFEQLDNTFIRQQGGTGLGLSIVKTIVEAMGSQITLESEPGKGSVFRFMISFQRKKQSEMSEPSRIQQVSITVSDASKNRVLLAEDNRVNQILVRKLLEPYALKIKFVTTGQEVLTALRQEEYDVLLMDVQMPVMDGITATEEIRNKTGNRIPIIGMTAYVQPNEVERCYAAGMNDYIAKPIDEGLFLKLLKKYIYLDTSVHAGYPAEESVSITRFPFLDKLCNFNINAIRKVLAEIEKQLQVDICSLENALMQQERSVMKRIVHHLKSTLSPLGPDSEAASILAEFADLLSEADDIKMKSAGMELIATLNTTRLSVQNELVEEM